MCDDFTPSAHDEALASSGATRREFAVMGAAAALAGCAGTAAGNGAPPGALTEATVEVSTPDGKADAFFVHPVTGSHPAVIFWPDIAGLRDAKKVMARRLATEGYAVLVVNQYYRSAPAPVLASFAEWRTPEGKARLAPMIAQITPVTVTRDGAAFAAFLDAQPAVDRTRGIGTQGYCMGGPFALRTVAAAPERVRAAASFHGAGLVTDAPDSPHRSFAGAAASYLIAIARNDDEKAPGDKDRLRQAAGRPAEIEVYPADHGWCVPDAPVYDAAQADRAFARLLALYAAL